MGERYESNPADVVAGFIVYPKDEYVIEFGEPKGYARKTTKGEAQAGIRVALRISDAANTGSQFKGKNIIYSGDELNEFGKATNKRMVMAALGYTTKEEDEKRFNEEVVPQHGWGFTSDGSVDDGWLLIKGKAAIVELDVNPSTDGSGKMFQQFKSFRPANAGVVANQAAQQSNSTQPVGTSA